MIAILYPLKMEDNLSKAYSTIYEELSDVVKRNDAINKANAMKNAQKKVVPDKVKEASKRQYTAGGPKDTGANKYTTADKKTIINHNKTKMNEGDTKAMKKYLDDKAKKLTKKRDAQSDAYKNNPAFDSTSPNPKYEDVGKFRQEWEALKLIETENYREQFDTWLDGIVEEGYDIERWSDEELVDTFINENNLWASREAVDSALLESDKKGKGSGKKDACYKKVKASASVWPSAYASGRLVQCRKKGAANYGKSKKEDFSDWRSDLQLDELNKQERMETAVRGGGGVGKRFAKKTLGANRAGKGKLFGGYDHRGTGNVGRRNINRFETKPVEREDGSLEKGTRKQSFKKVKVLNPVKKGGRTLNKFGSDFQDDYRSKDGLRATQSDHAQKKRREEHEKRRGVKTK